jgi:hypothetical protein
MRRIGKAKKKAIIDRMIELLEPAHAWGRGAWKRGEHKAPTGYQFCLLGAAEQAYEDVYGKPAAGDEDGGLIADQLSLVALIRAKRAMNEDLDPAVVVFTFNDDRQNTHKTDVLDLLREKQAELAAS